jgi:hypothetical protein
MLCLYESRMGNSVGVTYRVGSNVIAFRVVMLVSCQVDSFHGFGGLPC